jgi:hypothetical protein
MATMNSCHVGAIILDCLKDPDISIRQRALELTYQLVDANNIVELVRELLNYLVVAPPEHQSLLCSRVSAIVDKSFSWLREQQDVTQLITASFSQVCTRSQMESGNFDCHVVNCR